MKLEIVTIVTVWLVLGGVAAAGEADPQQGPQPAGHEPSAQAPGSQGALRIYLPRTVRTDENALALGSISVIRCQDKDLAKRAEAVAMGRAPWSKEQIVIDRPTILSRLASAGIRPGRVRFSGAEKAAVRRDEKVIQPEAILKAAEDVLEKERPGPTGCRWRLCGAVEALVIPACGDSRLQAKLVTEAPDDRVKVRVSVVADGRRLGGRELLFRCVYPARQAVTIKDIPAGGVISKENARMETVMVERRPKPDWTSPFGMIVTRRLPAGVVIPHGLIHPAKSAVIVRRNQTVVMRIQGFGFTVSAIGQALENGRRGDVIKVRNVDTKRVITARVGSDGTVRPLCEEVIQ